MTGGQIAVVGEGVSCMGSISEHNQCWILLIHKVKCLWCQVTSSAGARISAGGFLPHSVMNHLFGCVSCREVSGELLAFFPSPPHSQVTLFSKSVSVSVGPKTLINQNSAPDFKNRVQNKTGLEEIRSLT